MTKEDIGRVIETWRLSGEKRITQMDIAIKLGVSLPTAGNWCRGISTPDVVQLKKLEEMRPGLLELIFEK